MIYVLIVIMPIVALWVYQLTWAHLESKRSIEIYNLEEEIRQLKRKSQK